MVCWFPRFAFAQIIIGNVMVQFYGNIWQTQHFNTALEVGIIDIDPFFITWVEFQLSKGAFFSTYSYPTEATTKVEVLKDQRIGTINGSHNYEHDVAAKLHSFAQQMPRTLCIMSGNGSVSACTATPVCSLIHPFYRFDRLSEFDGKKRSCRQRLSDHNDRRPVPKSSCIGLQSVARNNDVVTDLRQQVDEAGT
ncbi:hypothetical protein L1987_15140 [Smallanthus sonchifolius]|uniref:Uncharacterized protein n=1 Tax=Smallanthus sonchifolius TaxID=185202 RepID=A0ACB9J891_9ASTR|nr:hypothetical protein L1987_15140 [Smallanthus sonchifolius]